MENEILRRETALRIRQGVASEAYDDVLALLGDYQRHVERALASCNADEPPPVELAREAGELMEWTLEVVRAARARARDQLDQASAVLRYRQPASQAGTWKIEG